MVPERQAFVPVETPLSSFTHLVVYTKSSLVEQTTPVALELVDTFAMVANISFSDFDLDLGDLGGTLTWSAPEDINQVTHYAVYFIDLVSCAEHLRANSSRQLPDIDRTNKSDQS